MTIKFGGKPTMRDKMKSVEPTGSLKKLGVKVTWMF